MRWINSGIHMPPPRGLSTQEQTIWKESADFVYEKHKDHWHKIDNKYGTVMNEFKKRKQSHERQKQLQRLKEISEKRKQTRRFNIEHPSEKALIGVFSGYKVYYDHINDIIYLLDTSKRRSEESMSIQEFEEESSRFFSFGEEREIIEAINEHINDMKMISDI